MVRTSVRLLLLFAIGGCGADLGEPCEHTGECNDNSICSRETWTCVPYAQGRAEIKKSEEQAKVEAEQLRLREEARMLKTSGVEAVAEAPVGAAPGPRVRVVAIKADDRAFAACRTDERLVGGGCNVPPGVDVRLRGSYPSGFSAGDTVGARWNCEAMGARGLHAYALCAGIDLRPSESSSAPQAPPSP